MEAQAAVWRVLWGCAGWMFSLPSRNLAWGERRGDELDAGGGIRDWRGLLETSWCRPLAASPSSSSCWRWIPCHKQLDAGGDSALGLPPSHGEHGQGRAVSHRELWLVGGSEMWVQEEVGRAVTVPVLMGGQQVGPGRLQATSCAFLALS